MKGGKYRGGQGEEERRREEGRESKERWKSEK